MAGSLRSGEWPPPRAVGSPRGWAPAPTSSTSISRPSASVGRHSSDQHRSMNLKARIPRLSKTPPSVKVCLEKAASLAPMSAERILIGGKKPGKADDAVTARGTVARPAWIRSNCTRSPGSRFCMIRPERVNEQMQPSLRFVDSMCSSGRSGSSYRHVSP